MKMKNDPHHHHHHKAGSGGGGGGKKFSSRPSRASDDAQSHRDSRKSHHAAGRPHRQAPNSRVGSKGIGGGGGAGSKSSSSRFHHHHHSSAHLRPESSSNSSSANQTGDESNGHSERDKDDRRLDEEQIFQVLEKPTQIYRWIGIRHAVNPVFLHRTLKYMRARDRPRRDAYAQRRKSFKLDDLYERSLEEDNGKKIFMCGDRAYLNIHFKEFSEGAECHQSSVGQVTVSAKLNKHSFTKRKDQSSLSRTIDCGSVGLGSEPLDGKLISLSCLNFLEENRSEDGADSSDAPTGLRHAFHLELTVEHVVTREALLTHVTRDEAPCLREAPAVHVRSGSADVDDETGEASPPAKKRRLSGSAIGSAKTSKTTRYSTELVIFDKNHRLFLTDGDYSVIMLPLDDPDFAPSSLEQRASVWEGVFEDAALDPLDEACGRQPTLKFLLNWSKTPCAGDVVVPPPPAAVLEDRRGIYKTVARAKAFETIGIRSSGLDSTETKISKSLGLDDEDGDENTEVLEKPRTRGRGLSTEDCSKGSLASQPCYTLSSHIYSTKPKKPLRLFYNFSHRSHQQLQTEHKGYVCPWCDVDCMNLYPLLKHLRLSHARFTFFYSPQTKAGRIDVSINPSYDGSYVGNAQDPALSRLGFSFSRFRAIQRTPMTQILVHPSLRIRTPHEGVLDEFLESTARGEDSGLGIADNRSGYMSGHNRQYYRSTTVQPMTAADMDYDSETDTKPGWLKTKMCKLMDDFTDVNSGEKEVLKLWNIHVLEYDFTGYRHLPDLLQKFVRDKGEILFRKKLENNFLQHLINLQDFGLIKPSVVHLSFTALLRLKQEQSLKLVVE